MHHSAPDRALLCADRVAASDHVVFRALDDEAIILDLDTGEYFGLDEVGRRVWELMERDEHIASIVAGIVRDYEVEPGIAESDVLELLETMRARRLIVVRERS